jgi:hypothetical protein
MGWRSGSSSSACLTNYKALSSNPSTAKTPKTEVQWEVLLSLEACSLSLFLSLSFPFLAGKITCSDIHFSIHHPYQRPKVIRTLYLVEDPEF